MRKLFFILGAIVLLTSCAVKYNYLPDREKISDSPYGSYLSVKTSYGISVKGELIAVEGDSLIIGDLNEHLLHIIDLKMVSSSYLQFSKSKSFGILPVLALSHGWWLVFTVPLNSIAALSLYSADKQEGRINNPDFTKIYIYSRYPQGLPEGFNESMYTPVKSINKMPNQEKNY